jgi:hypothetical protein
VRWSVERGHVVSLQFAQGAVETRVCRYKSWRNKNRQLAEMGGRIYYEAA